MRYRLIELLMNLFEKSLIQLKEIQQAQQKEQLLMETENLEQAQPKTVIYNAQKENSVRIFTYEETLKFTKASYQFLMHLNKLGIIGPDSMEIAINHLMLSDSRLVGLNETKWTLRNILSEGLDENQLAFLDLVLYQKEDNLPTH